MTPCRHWTAPAPSAAANCSTLARPVALLLMAALAPGTATATAANLRPEPAEVFVYFVQPGDTLVGMQQQWLRPGLGWRALQKLGRAATPSHLQAGTRLAIPHSWLLEVAAPAEVLHVNGPAWLERPGAAREALQAGAGLRSGDSIHTEEQSSVSVRVGDGSRSVVGPLSAVRLDKLARTGPAGPFNSTLQLERGQVDTRVTPGRPAPRFELRTPAANLGVRGTEFRARVEDTTTLADVLNGRVAVAALAVDAGFGVSATAIGIGVPRRLPAAPELRRLCRNASNACRCNCPWRRWPPRWALSAQPLQPLRRRCATGHSSLLPTGPSSCCETAFSTHPRPPVRTARLTAAMNCGSARATPTAPKASTPVGCSPSKPARSRPSRCSRGRVPSCTSRRSPWPGRATRRPAATVCRLRRTRRSSHCMRGRMASPRPG